jgi:hypothetical protein
MGERSGAPRARARHQSSFRNLRLRLNYRSPVSQLTVTHPSWDALISAARLSSALAVEHTAILLSAALTDITMAPSPIRLIGLIGAVSTVSSS